MKIQIVHINPEGDGATALYVDDELHTHGDYYHNKIGDWISGFLDGLEFARNEGWCQVVTVENWYVLSESDIDESDLEDLMLDPPIQFADLPTDFLTQEY